MGTQEEPVDPVAMVHARTNPLTPSPTLDICHYFGGICSRRFISGPSGCTEISVKVLKHYFYLCVLR